MILLLGATMWHHIRTEEGGSAADRPVRLPLTRAPCAALRLQQQLILARSVRRSKLLQNRCVHSAKPRRGRLNQQLGSIRERKRAVEERVHAAAGFQARSGESGKESNKKKTRKKKKRPDGFGVAHPPRPRHTLALADVSGSLSRGLAWVRGSVGHTGALILPSASPKPSRHLTGARNKVEEVLLPHHWTLRASSHSLQNRFPGGGGGVRRACVRARAPQCSCPRSKAFFYI